MHNKFHTRSFVSVFSCGSFLLMTVTGLVLYFVPQGRVAYWIDWHLLGLSKTDWGNIHIVSSILFGVAGLVHLYLNWSPFWAYLTKKVGGSLRYGREAALAGTLTLFLLAGTLYEVPPLNFILDLGESLKTAWVKDKSYEPPFGHAELVSLKILAKKESIDLARGLVSLGEKGIIFESADEKLVDVATRNRVSPRDVYAIFSAGAAEQVKASEMPEQLSPEAVEERYAGSGIGRKRFSWILEDLGLSEEVARKRLARHGVMVTQDETLKDLGERAGYDPMELLLALTIAEYQPKKQK